MAYREAPGTAGIIKNKELQYIRIARHRERAFFAKNSDEKTAGKDISSPRKTVSTVLS